MKKPEIEINEIGAMGPDGLELKIGDNITLYCKRYAEAQVIEEMLDALIMVYEAYQPIHEDAVKEIENVLTKAGVEL